MIQFNKKPQLWWVAQGFADLLDAIILIIGFGFVSSSFGWRFCAWYTTRKITKRMEKKNALH